MPQVLRHVKAVLGPEAVILESVEAGGRVTVTAAQDDDPVLAPPGSDGDLAREVRRLLDVVRGLVADERRSANGPELLGLHRALLAQGVDGAIAAELVRETATRIEGGRPLDAAVAGALDRAHAAAPAAGVRILVGPPGDGKTTTIAKLAAQVRAAGRTVALVGADTYRLGAAAELAAYGRVLGVPVATAAGPDELARALAAAECRAELVLVDTPGAGPGQTAELAELGALVAAAGDRATLTLVASAATSGPAACETLAAFAPLVPGDCVLTKLDLAPGGSMVGHLWGRGIPVSHVATGRRIPHDLVPATPDRLARCLLPAREKGDGTTCPRP